MPPNRSLTDRWKSLGCCRCESEKKSTRQPGADIGESVSSGPRCDGFQPNHPNSLEAFRHRLRERCSEDDRCHGFDREDRIKSQAEHAVALAREAGILIEAAESFGELTNTSEIWLGSEHVVEFSELDHRYGKTTIPPAFGLVPEIRRFPTVNLRGDPEIPAFREAVEFVKGTPLEYLERWIASNEIFGDDVRLSSVIRWSDGQASFCITQPQYDGIPAESRDIEAHFISAGWERLSDPGGNLFFYHLAFDTVAAHIARRNCYLNDGGLQPFDVMLRKPDEKMRRFFGLD